MQRTRGRWEGSWYEEKRTFDLNSREIGHRRGRGQEVKQVLRHVADWWWLPGVGWQRVVIPYPSSADGSVMPAVDQD